MAEILDVVDFWGGGIAGGEVVGRLVGARPKAEFLDLAEALTRHAG